MLPAFFKLSDSERLLRNEIGFKVMRLYVHEEQLRNIRELSHVLSDHQFRIFAGNPLI